MSMTRLCHLHLFSLLHPFLTDPPSPIPTAPSLSLITPLMAKTLRGHNNEFHEWLFSSAYVKGPDQTSRVLSRKKHRSKRNSAPSDLESARIEAEERIRVLCKVSNRHYRRWMNDRLLRELGPPLDAQEIGSLFAPPPWGEKTVATPFERITTIGDSFSHDMAAWEPFRNNVDMDAEEELLHRNSRKNKRVSENVLRQDFALAAWRNVPHRCRDVLRRSSSWPLVEVFEKRIIDFLMQEDMGGPSTLMLDVDDSYHRMLLHGICEFYGLLSQSMSMMEDREGRKISAVIRVHIKKTVKSARFAEQQSKLPFTLTQFLGGLKQTVSITDTSK